MGLPQYLSAQMSAIAATTKAGTLEIAANAAVTLISGLLSILVVILVIYIILRFLKYYKTRAAEDRLARQVANRLIPMLEEINNYVLALQEELKKHPSTLHEIASPIIASQIADESKTPKNN